MKIKCTKCGFENLENSSFCQECGFELDGHAEKTETQNIEDNKKPLHKHIEEIDDVIFKPNKKRGSFLKWMLASFVLIGVFFILLIVWYAANPEEDTSSTNNSASPATETTSNNGWKPFTSTEHGFKINFPADYESERIPEEVLDNGYTYRGIQYLSSPSDDELYMVQVADYDIYPSDYDNRLGLEGAINGMTDSETNLTSSSFTTFRGYDAINFTLTTGEGYYAKGLAFIKDDMDYIKLYLMTVFNSTANFGDFDKFISSFELR